MKLRLDPGRSGDCSDWVVPSGWFLWLADSEANLVLIYRGKELTSSWAMTLTAMSPRLVLVLTVHAVTHCDDSVDHCCTNAGCFCCACCESVVLCRTAAAAWFFIWLRLAFLCLFFFLCASRNLTSLRKLSSILICHANCVRPNMPSLTIQQRIEASFRSWSFFPDTHTHKFMMFLHQYHISFRAFWDQIQIDGQSGFSRVQPWNEMYFLWQSILLIVSTCLNHMP